MKKSLLFLVLTALGVAAQSAFAGSGGFGAPDGGTTAALLAMGLGGLVWARRYFRR
ncbi:MAG: VPDSG-CTERM sorting domain-containing protein [Verrucomicrobiota bacterium]|jgi:hypothetical protein